MKYPAEYPFAELDIVVLDWETFWGVGYSLKSPLLSTSEYVRDERFQSHGLGAWHSRTQQLVWVSGEDERDYLDAIDWSRTALLAHNMQFDGFILHEHYGYHPAFYMDTLSMSRANWGLHVRHGLNDLGMRCELGGKEGSDILKRTKGKRELDPEEYEEMGFYCMRDVELCRDVFDYMVLEDGFPAQETRYIDFSLRAFCDPRLTINTSLAQAELDDERDAKKRICEDLGIIQDDLHSADKFANLLREAGLEEDRMPMKFSEKKQKDICAFAKNDEEFLALRDDPLVGPLVEARLRIKSTIQETKAARLIKHGDPGPLPIALNYWKATTGRWGGGDKLNPQNFPAGRGRQTQRLRNAITAPSGYVMIRVDSSQIEPRHAAYLADDTDLLAVFRSGKDPYLHMASELYQKDFGEDAEKYHKERTLGKVCTIALTYGMGIPRFMATAKVQYGLTLSLELAAHAHHVYRTRKDKIIQRLWTQMERGLIHMSIANEKQPSLHFKMLEWQRDKVWLSNDCAIWYQEMELVDSEYSSDFVYRTQRGYRRIYPAMQLENVNQAECRNIVAWQSLPISERYYICLLAHDETVFLAPESEADEAKQFALDCFTATPPWTPGLPMAATAKVDDCYGK